MGENQGEPLVDPPAGLRVGLGEGLAEVRMEVQKEAGRSGCAVRERGTREAGDRQSLEVAVGQEAATKKEVEFNEKGFFFSEH